MLSQISSINMKNMKDEKLVDEIRFSFIVERVYINKTLGFNKEVIVITYFYFISNSFFCFSFTTFLVSFL